MTKPLEKRRTRTVKPRKSGQRPSTGSVGPLARWRRRVVFPVVVLGIWSLVAQLELVWAFKLPPPWKIVTTAQSIGFDELLGATRISVQMAFTGFVIGVVLGIGVGLLFGYSRFVRDYFEFAIDIVRPIPKFALIPLFILWFGIGQAPQVGLVAFGVFLVMTIQTTESIRNIPDVYVRAAVTSGASRAHIYRTVVMPAIVPHLIAGIRLAAAWAWGLDVAAELLGSREGIGFMMQLREKFLDTAGVMLGVIMFAFLAIVTDTILQAIGRRFTRWSPRAMTEGVVAEMLGR